MRGRDAYRRGALLLGAAALLAAPVRAQDFGQVAPGRGIGFSFSGSQGQADEPETTVYDQEKYWDLKQRRKRGIFGSTSNAPSQRCLRSKEPAQLEKRGAHKSRFGQYAPAASKGLKEFRQALWRVTSTEITEARGVDKASVWTATPPACVRLDHRQYSVEGLYRGTLRDTYRGITIVRHVDYKAGLGSVESFWLRVILANTHEKPYFKWLFHNWEQLELEKVRNLLGADMYEDLLRRQHGVTEKGVERTPKKFYLEIPDRDVLTFLEHRPELARDFFRATYELDRAQ